MAEYSVGYLKAIGSHPTSGQFFPLENSCGAETQVHMAKTFFTPQ
jgi:hypothetical protein